MDCGEIEIGTGGYVLPSDEGRGLCIPRGILTGHFEIEGEGEGGKGRGERREKKAGWPEGGDGWMESATEVRSFGWGLVDRVTLAKLRST